MITTFRSKVQTRKDCPRKRWLTYEIPAGGKVHGVKRKGFSRYLLLGSGVHEALRVMLSGEGDTDKAAAAGLAVWDYAMATEGLSSPDGKQWVTEEYEWIAKQDRALLEGLVRGFGLWVLPRLLEEFEILEAEQDRVYEPVPGFRYIVKLDVLMRRKTTGEFFVMSFKSYAYWGDQQVRAAQVDDQNYGEPWGMEGVMRGWHNRLTNLYDTGVPDPDGIEDIPEWFRNGYANGEFPSPPVISGVMMGVMRKGAERKNKNGVPIRYSPFVRGWYREEGMDIATGEPGVQWAWSWDVPKVSKDGSEYMGILGKGWTVFQAWDHPQGVKGWVEQLASGMVQPECGDVMQKQFEFAEPHLSKEWEKDRWARQIMHQEQQEHERAERVREKWLDPTVEGEEKLALLDLEYPMNTRKCYDYNSQCGMWQCCFVSPELTLDPTGSGLYQVRESHHEREAEGEE